MLYSNSISDRLLGCYLIDPTLCINSKYPIDKDEFQVLFHKIVYVVCHNLSLNNYKSISIMDFEQWLEPYHSQYQVYQDNNGADYIATITELTDINNFEAYYNEFRKFSCLNAYKNQGFDISKFWDVDKTEESQLENLNNYSIDDIINYYEKIQSDIHKQYLLNHKIESMICGENFDELLSDFEEEPMIGGGLCSPTMNNLYRGWCRGHLILRGSPSSFGKAQPVNTIIPTPNGYKRLGDIQVGDYVFDRQGNPTKVLGVFPQGMLECYIVKLSDGRQTMCNDEHLWTYYYNDKLYTNTLRYIIDNLSTEQVYLPVSNIDITYKYTNKIQITRIVHTSFKSEMVCIYVDNDEHLYLTNDYIVTHNTCMGISDQNNVSVLKIWSDKDNCFIDNPYYQGKGAYIHTEQKMREEIQPRFMANVSGIPYHKILDGNFTTEEKERLSMAGKIVKESELKLINYPDFTANGLKELIKNLSLEGYEYITFDYCWDNFYIGAELKALSGTAIRQDMSLLHLVDTLKLSAEQFDVAIATMIQLNGREKEVEIVDESCLFGSKSVKTKLDNGSIYMYPRQKELKQVETLIAKWNKDHNPNNFGTLIMPNAVSHCFKTRYGRFGQNIKVWHYVDNSIGKMTDMFATTWDNKPIDIPPLYIERKL